MHRFRKKSDAKRIQVPPDFQDTPPHSQDRELLPELPPASDFRTSLILPDLSRRFTLLRTSTGDPVSLEDLRSRFAEQRARGAENQISEEEEDMILETLGRIRSKNVPQSGQSSGEEHSLAADDLGSSGRQSVQSSSTMPTSLSGSLSSNHGGRPSKRYSNNLFASGRFRDYSYVRSATKAGSTRSAVSIAPTESSLSLRGHTSSNSDSLRPVTPEESVPSSSPHSSPDKSYGIRSAPLAPPSPYGEYSLSAAEYRISKTLGPSVFKRASVALEKAIKEIEEEAEAEDEIVMPRSAPIPRNRESDNDRTSAVYEAGMAISFDRQIAAEADERRASPVPSRILPGYIPGMPRPMTPRDNIDSDDQRSHSTTPRASSPLNSSPSPILTTSLVGRESTSSPSRSTPRPISPPIVSPLFRTATGRYTPDDSSRNGELDFESFSTGRRRPASPLSGPAYQPMAVSSRPNTPSNITWTPQKSSGQTNGGHSANSSWASELGGTNTDMHSSLERSKSTTRSLQSPALPDSPMLDRGYGNLSSFTFGSSPPSGQSLPDRPPSTISRVDIGSPVGSPSRVLRSPTPTQASPSSPTTPNIDTLSRSNSKRSSKQHAPSSPFSLGPYPPLVFSPIANSSRSSFESAGSSYHSWEDERHRDRSLALFSDGDSQQPPWYNISTPEQAPDDEWDAEDIVSRYAGLKKSDFMAMQEKLVTVAIAKTATPDTRDRAPSLRRRRPSTSQSNYSLNGRDTRIGSPPPQTQPPASPTLSSSDQYATALLNSMVDSIQSPRQNLNIPETTTITQQDKDISPITRRNRDLAQALFGADDEEDRRPTPTISLPAQIMTSVSKEELTHDPTSPSFPRTPLSSSSSPRISPYQLPQNLSTPRIPLSPENRDKLTEEVQRKTDAAMLALRRRPSNPSAMSPPGSVSRKRVSPHQISTPRLVSASTSVDTIPVLSPTIIPGSPLGPLKLGSRFKRFRGTLKPKALPTGDEVTPYPLDLRSPHPIQTARYPPTLNVPGVPASATDTGRFKVPIPSPPASAGPGLKGFMARFRGKQRAVDHESELSGPSQFSHAPLPTPSRLSPSPRQDTPVLHDEVSDMPLPTLQSPPPSKVPPAGPSTRFETSHAPSASSDTHESVALKQLFDAASNLGLDQQALNDLLARSGSTSSRSTEWTYLTRNNSTTATPRLEPRDENIPEIAQPLSVSVARPSIDNQSSQDETIIRKSSLRKQTDHSRRPREGQNENSGASAIVRRTIIFPSESRAFPADFNSTVRKSSHRRRASVTSASSRSVHDRVPTPPPSKTPTGARRFSGEGSPPVPHMPASLSTQVENLLHVPPPTIHADGTIEKSNSTYESLYEMYSGESKAVGLSPNTANGPDTGQTSQSTNDVPPNSESGPALEVIELANGETIWSIVNGLRDDDAESVYASRASFASEFSTRDNGEGVQIFFKEHTRNLSKGSTSSYISRGKKTIHGKPRPETKVFYSSSAQIGRLIENLSQGQEAGSFNFMLNRGAAPGHSASSSFSETDMQWTVEERLEQMLGSMRSS